MYRFIKVAILFPHFSDFLQFAFYILCLIFVISMSLVNENNYVLNLSSIPNQTPYKEVLWSKSLNISNLLNNHKINAPNLSNLITNVRDNSDTEKFSIYLKFYTLNTEINSKKTINHENLLNYLRADSLKLLKR